MVPLKESNDNKHLDHLIMETVIFKSIANTLFSKFNHIFSMDTSGVVGAMIIDSDGLSLAGK